MWPKIPEPRIEPPKIKLDYPIGKKRKSAKKRRPFRTSTKKREWMRAAGRDPFGPFVKTSKCRRCKRKLNWGDRTYAFDHKNNKEWDNSQDNCYLVCLICHGKATVITKRRMRDRFTGMTVGYKTIKKKVGYKKERKRTRRKRRKSRPHSPFDVGIRPIRF